MPRTLGLTFRISTTSDGSCVAIAAFRGSAASLSLRDRVEVFVSETLLARFTQEFGFRPRLQVDADQWIRVP